MKIRFLFTGNFDVDGVARHFEKDSVAEVSQEDAVRLIEGRCAVELVDKAIVSSKLRTPSKKNEEESK